MVNAELETQYGLASSKWTLNNGVFQLDVTIPTNTTAEITLPLSNKKVNVGSGNYHFQYNLKP